MMLNGPLLLATIDRAKELNAGFQRGFRMGAAKAGDD
jgi:hypothetical protein